MSPVYLTALPFSIALGVDGVCCSNINFFCSRGGRSPCPAARSGLRAGALSPELWQQHGHETAEVNKPTIQAFLCRIDPLFFLTAWLGFWVLILCIVPYLKRKRKQNKEWYKWDSLGLVLAYRMLLRSCRHYKLEPFCHQVPEPSCIFKAVGP